MVNIVAVNDKSRVIVIYTTISVAMDQSWRGLTVTQYVRAIHANSATYHPLGQST